MRTFLALLATHLLALLLASPARAHLPYFAETPHYRPETPFPLPDGRVSRVVYTEMPCESPQVWLEFSGKAGDEVLVTLGVPQLDLLREYRPAIAISGPGFPASAEPALQGRTGRVLPPLAAGVKPFYEMFSNTSSWILVEEMVTLPADGTFRVTAWDPEPRTARLWIAVGKAEEFDMPAADLVAALERVREFHAPSYDPDFGKPCVHADATADAGGCAALPVPALALLGLAVRRRNRSQSA
jgi:hypothetical protein